MPEEKCQINLSRHIEEKQMWDISEERLYYLIIWDKWDSKIENWPYSDYLTSAS